MATLRSNSFSLEVQAATSPGVAVPPSYYSSMTPNVWYTVAGPSPQLGLSATNVPDDRDPDPSRVADYDGASGFRAAWTAWNGTAFVKELGPSGSITHWGGGHGDYFGNQIMTWDAETRTWERYTEPYTEGSGDLAGTFLSNGRHPDGSFGVPHTYSHIQGYNGQMICPKTIDAVGAPFGGASAERARPAIYDFATNQWREGRLNSAMLARSGGSSCLDTTRGGIWTFDTLNTTWGFFDPSTNNGDGTWGTWTTYASPDSPFDATDTQLTHDPVTDRLLFRESNQQLRVYDPSNLTAAGADVSESNRPTVDDSSPIWYSPALGGIILYRNEASTIYLATTTNNWASCSWSTLPVSSNGNTFEDTRNGIYTKANLVVYDNGAEILYLTEREYSGVKALRIN